MYLQYEIFANMELARLFLFISPTHNMCEKVLAVVAL